LNKAVIVLSLIFILSTGSVTGRSRNSSIENYLEDLRLTPEGFANTISDEIEIHSTTKALTITRLLNHEVKDELDILLYYQRSQNENGGFGSNPEAESNWDATVSAIHGLWELSVNSTYLATWEIDHYLNATAVDLLFYEAIENNQTILKTHDLTLDLIVKWNDYILSSIIINVIPAIPNVFLGFELRSLQLSNGSYSTFDLAVNSINLLTLIGQVPDAPELSSKFIRAYATKDGMFSSKLNGTSNLRDTYNAVLALDQLGRINELTNRKKIILKILEHQKPNSGFSDINQDKVTLESTWYAVKILSLLDAIDELLVPDVLQTEGFVHTSFFVYILSIVLITNLRRGYR
jgi:prenyltransferase beta subunit